jgi:hypothetical protein
MNADEIEITTLPAHATYGSETSVLIAAPPAAVFAVLDDHSRLSAHMAKSSWKMGGGRMKIEVDSGQGREVGSHIRLSGSVFGIRLDVEEVVITHDPPWRKRWRTVGSPRLLVIGSYEMGFNLAATATGTALRVYITYALPETKWLGRLFGRYYANWCIQRMAADAAKQFGMPLNVRSLEAGRH